MRLGLLNSIGSVGARWFRSRRGRVCAEAWTALTATSYDAAIVDLGLPDGDGLSLLAELRANGTLTPVLVLTARDAVEDRVRDLDTGAGDYLVKPFAIEEFIAR